LIRFSRLRRHTAREPKNPPAAVSTQIVIVTAVSLVVIIFPPLNQNMMTPDCHACTPIALMQVKT